jgi:hypothetical protein
MNYYSETLEYNSNLEFDSIYLLKTISAEWKFVCYFSLVFRYFDPTDFKAKEAINSNSFRSKEIIKILKKCPKMLKNLKIRNSYIRIFNSISTNRI